MHGLAMITEAPAQPWSIELRGAECRCPHLVVPGFLGADTVQRLLLHVEEQRAAFKVATVYNRDSGGERLNSESRNCLRLADIGPFKSLMKEAVRAILPAAAATLGILGQPAEAYEFEFCAYGDGAFFDPHIDTLPMGSRRIVSCVYYFFREPACFTGGELRLHAWRRLASSDADPSATMDVVPQCDSLTIFPSSLRHEVRPIACPSGAWRDFRFAINCWAHRRAAPRTAP